MDQYYTCPMHPNVQQKTPGRCLECGMELVLEKAKLRRGEHAVHLEPDKHEGHSLVMFARKFWVSTLLTIPVVLYSDILDELFEWQAPAFPGSLPLPAILGSAIFFYGGWIFLIGAWREIRGRLPGMMTLIALAIGTAYLYSIAVVLGVPGKPLFWELSTLITVMLLGHWMEMRAVQGAQGALKELSKLLPDTAEIIRDGKPQTIPLLELRVDDHILVRPGARIPADGVVEDGVADVNEAIVTGESRPVRKEPGSDVIAGITNGDGALTVRITKIGEETFLSGVMRLVREAQASKSRLQTLSDRAARYLTVIAVGTALITFIAWLIVGAEFGFTIERVVAVLVIACPHALGLAVPLVVAISTTMAVHNGFLVRNRLALEAARTIDTVLFDKNGTLTKGEFGVTDILAVEGEDSREVLRLAAAADAPSEHPVARAIVKQAEIEGILITPVQGFERLAGKGSKGIFKGAEVFIGGTAILEHARIDVSAALKQRIEEEKIKGKTVVYVLRNGNPIGAIALADLIRDESRDAIKSLKELGVSVGMITGDAEAVAKRVALELGIDEYFSEVRPEEKSEKVKILQKKGKKVVMVGDGVNDAPALPQADVGIAIGAGTNIAIESAGIILVRNDPRDIPRIIRLSRITYTKMVQNLFWATGYNVVAIPLAAGVLASKGILLQPALAALFMSFSTVIVAVNAVLLRRKTLI